MNAALAVEPIGTAQHAVLSASGVFMALLLALVLDYSAAGSDSLRDKFILILGTPAVYSGWNGGPFDLWCIQKISAGLNWLLTSTGAWLHLTGVAVNLVIGMASGCLFVYALFAILPNRIKVMLGKKSPWLGKATAWKLPTSVGRINWKLWTVAICLGLFGDLARGWIGGPVVPAIELAGTFTNWLLANLFGAS